MRFALGRAPFLAAVLLIFYTSPATAQGMREEGAPDRPAHVVAEPDDGSPAPSRSPADALRPTPHTAALAVGVRDPADMVREDRSAADDDTSAAAQAKNSEGLAFMIAGGAAFVAGLIIGGDAGTVIAVAGVGLGVYGIIVYF